MMNKTEAPQISDAMQNGPAFEDSALNGVGSGAESKQKEKMVSGWRNAIAAAADRLKHVFVGIEDEVSPLQHSVVAAIQKTWKLITVFFLSLLFSGAVLAYETQPLGVAFLCAAGAGAMLPVAAAGVITALLSSGGDAAGLYLTACLLTIGMRYAVGRFIKEDAQTEEIFGGKRYRNRSKPVSAADKPAGDDGGGISLVRLGRAIFPSGVFRQSITARVGISVVAAAPAAAGYLLGGDGSVEAVCRAVFVLCAIPAFTYLFCGFFDRGRCAPALGEGGIGAVCYALTVSVSGVMLFGFSLRLICAHLLTLYISRKGGYLRGGLCGLLCGFACDVLYAPSFALIGAVAGVLWSVHAAPAVLLSLLAGAAYAIYVGAFPAIRSVVPEMILSTALAYPLIRYLPDAFKKNSLFSQFLPTEAAPGAVVSAPSSDAGEVVTAEMLGVPSLHEQLDALSGILNGLSTTFYHLSDRVRKPGLYEIRQLCESTADRYCAHCAYHNLCWEKEFSSTADAMGRITLCIHRKGRAEAGAAFAPLDRRCPNLQKMLAAMNDAAAVLCEEKITKDKTEVAAGDYEGMARLLRASAEESVHACEKDVTLSRRLGRAMGRIGFRAKDVSVYGTRRRTVVASGIDLGFSSAGMFTGGLLGTEELREAFSALSGVRYQPPEYRLTDGGKQLVMTMRAQPKITVSSGHWGEKKAGEEVTGDVLALFANRSDYFYALVCDGMGSGREASVTAQISALFLEKLLSVSTARGAALNLLDTYLRSRTGECSVTIDLCEVDMITGDARFVKCGAAASYLLRGDNMFRISSNTMPLGILREVSAEETTFTLCDGDLLLFFSDGVCGECEDTSWIAASVKEAEETYAKIIAKERILRQQKEEEASAPSQAAPDAASDGTKAKIPAQLDFLAKSLGETAKSRIGRQDDMTVAVLKIGEIA